MLILIKYKKEFKIDVLYLLESPFGSINILVLVSSLICLKLLPPFPMNYTLLKKKEYYLN